ncbi:MAG TPA: hypothetical protein VF837_04485 [Patescibacteria group bacterium]
MRELIRLLDLIFDSGLQISILGKCFTLTKIDEETVHIKNCHGEELTTNNWNEAARFIRIRVIDKIGVNDQTLYEHVLVELELAFVNHDRPNEKVRKERTQRLHDLEISEPLLTKLMRNLDR